MNSPTTSIPDLAGLRKAVQEFQPNPRRLPFTNLKTVHDSIAKLRQQQVSYATIAELLRQHGVRSSRARVAEYGRIVLEGGKKRKQRKRAQIEPAAKPTPATPPATAVTSDVQPPPKEYSPFHSRGPHIANVKMMSPEEAKEFNDSLKPKPAAS